MYESIETLSKTYSVSSICKVLNVNKSSYFYYLYFEKNNKDKLANFLCEVINVYAKSSGIYGAPKICATLNKNGFACSIAKVSLAMRVIGIRSIVSKKFPHRKSRITEKEKTIIVNLIKNIVITRLNQVWTTDITYIQTINEGTFYLISFIDCYSKKVVAWGLFTNQKTDKLIIVLKEAIKKRKPLPGLICHSDKGSQMRSKLYRNFLKQHNFAFSYTSLDHSCDENAAQESFHASLKKEKLYQMKLYTYEDAFKAIYEYIEGFYNPIRIHSAIGYLSPDDFEKLHNI